MADQPARTASRGRFRHQVVDWRRAARLVALGTNLAEAARRVGCSRSQLSRRRHHDPLFQSWIEESRGGGGDEPPGGGGPAAHHHGGLRRALVAAIEGEVKAGNVRVILWLADRLKLLEPPPGEQHAPDRALQDMLRGLSASELQEFASLRDDDAG